MSDVQAIQTGEAPAAIGPYSQALAVDGWVYCSGQIPLVPGTKDLRNASIEEATRQVLANMKAVLAAAGCEPQHVVKATVYMTDLKEFPQMNAEYEAFFGTHKPARAAVQVAALPAGARVEIDCVARRP